MKIGKMKDATRQRILLYSAFAAIASVLLVLIDPFHRSDEKMGVKSKLRSNANAIWDYIVAFGEYPDSLKEAWEKAPYAKGNPSKVKIRNRSEEFSHSTKEVPVYDGSGGWVYSKEGGYIGINSPKYKDIKMYISKDGYFDKPQNGDHKNAETTAEKDHSKKLIKVVPKETIIIDPYMNIKTIDGTKLSPNILTISIMKKGDEYTFTCKTKKFFKLNDLLDHLKNLNADELKNGICLAAKFKTATKEYSNAQKEISDFARKRNIPLYSEIYSSSKLNENKYFILYDPTSDRHDILEKR